MPLLIIQCLEILLLTLCVPVVFSELTAEQRNCRSEGQQVPLGNAWFVCRMGKLVPVACLTPTGARVDIEQRYVQGQQLMKCTQNSPSSVTFRAVGCFFNGQMLMERQTGHNDRYWFVCSLDGKGAVKVRSQKCLGEQGAVVEPGLSFRRGSIEYQCTESHDEKGVTSEPTACYMEDVKYDLDEEIISKDGFWYRCVKTDAETAIIQVKGCVRNGQKLSDGQAFDVQGFRQTCRIKPILNKSDVHEVQSGMSCLEMVPGSKINHPVGSTWVMGRDLVKYVVQCTQDQLSISQRLWRCVYDGPEGIFEIESGCYKKFGDIIFQCSIRDWKFGDAQIIYSPNAEAEQKLQNGGIKKCETRKP